MLALLSSPEVQGALGTVLVAAIVGIAAWLKKDNGKDDLAAKDRYDDIIEHLTEISISLKAISVDFHDYVTIMKYMKSGDKGG